MIYLDTNVVIFTAAKSMKKLSQTVIDLIENTDQLCVSPMVVMECEYLYEIERIKTKPHKIFKDLEKYFGIQVCDKPFTKIINEAVKYSWTRDPFDRIITAQAAIDGDMLLTKDKNIRKHYKHAVW